MVRRSLTAVVLMCGTAGLVLAGDYKNATLKEMLPPSKDGKPAPNAVFEYEYTDKKTKRSETKTVEVFFALGYMRAPGPIDEKGKPIALEKFINYNKVGVVADIVTEKRKDGHEYVLGFKVKTPPPDGKKDK